MTKYLKMIGESNLILTSLQTKNGYCLQLANGQGWHIIASEEVHLFVKKFASIMKLKHCKHSKYPKLIFILRNSDRKGLNKIKRLNSKVQIANETKKILDYLPKNGWKNYNRKIIKMWSHDEVLDFICEIRDEGKPHIDIIKMTYALYPIYNQAINAGGLPFHAALVKRKRKGILLVAPGSGGKSTCCNRIPSSWNALCDDETLVVQNDRKAYFTHPFPTWGDYLLRNLENKWKVEQYIPLAAIFFLKKSKENKALPIRQAEAAVFINKSVSQVLSKYLNNLDSKRARIFKEKLFDNACELAKVIPAFILHVSLYGKFWEEIEKALHY